MPLRFRTKIQVSSIIPTSFRHGKTPPPQNKSLKSTPILDLTNRKVVNLMKLLLYYVSIEQTRFSATRTL